MRYMSSDAARPTADPAEDDLFDVTEHAASPRGTLEEAPPYKPVTPQIARKVGNTAWRYLNPNTNDTGRSLMVIALTAVSAFLIAWSLYWLIGLLPIGLAAGAFGIAGIVLGAILMTSAIRTGDDVLFGRVHLGLMLSGAMAMAGWLPGLLLVSVIAPGAVGYGLGSFGALFVAAFRAPGSPTPSDTADQEKPAEAKIAPTPDVSDPVHDDDGRKSAEHSSAPLN